MIPSINRVIDLAVAMQLPNARVSGADVIYGLRPRNGQMQLETFNPIKNDGDLGKVIRWCRTAGISLFISSDAVLAESKEGSGSLPLGQSDDEYRGAVIMAICLTMTNDAADQ